MMNYYELIKTTKEDVFEELEKLDIHGGHNYNEIVNDLTKRVRKTKSINQEAALVTVLSLGLWMDEDGNVDFAMPSTKKCLEKFKHIRRAISKGVTIFKCYSDATEPLTLQKCYGYWFTVAA